ncbi:hypothetical protein IAU59_005492 [Kwoniella sp. CBS 9459]
MHRHFSDTAYTPLKPSRLNPNPALNPHPNLNLNLQLPLAPGSGGGTGLGVGAMTGISVSPNPNPNSVLAMRPSRGLPVGLMQRGTVSMPTSPVLKSMRIDVDVDVDVNVPGLNGDMDFLDTPHPPALSISPTTPATAADPFGLATSAASPGMGFPGRVPFWDATAQAFYNPPSQNGMDALHSALPPAHASPFDISPPLDTAPPGPHAPHWFGSPPSANALMNHHKAYEPAQGQTAGGSSGHEDTRSNFGGFVSPFDLSPIKPGTQSTKPEKTIEQTGGNLLDDAYDREAPDMDLDPIQDEGQQNAVRGGFGTNAQDIEMGTDMDIGMGMGLGPGGRRKRIQVRIACTHCQKACKKCSNTRPCERCVKYGLPDCVDSSRKPRKTGIKRGPYKRRSSRYEHPVPSASASSPAAAGPTYASSHLPPPPPPNTTQSSFSNTASNVVHRGPNADSFTSAQHTQVQAQAHAHASSHRHLDLHAHAHHQHQHQVNTHHTRASIPHTHMSGLKTHLKAQTQTTGAPTHAYTHAHASMPRHGKIIGPERRRSSTTARGKDSFYGSAHGNGNCSARSQNRSSSVTTINEDLSNSILHYHDHDSTSDQPMAHAHQIDSYPPFPRQQATGINNTTISEEDPLTASLSLLSQDQSKQDESVFLPPPHPSAESTRASNPNSNGGMRAQQANMTESESMLLSDPQSVLAQALSNALSAPQTTWINGQRQPIPLTSPPGTGVDNSIPGPLHHQQQQPQSGSAGLGADARRFPFSLGGGVGDPFSRAVSPIKGISSTSTSKSTTTMKSFPQMAAPGAGAGSGSGSGRGVNFDFDDANGIANSTFGGVAQGDGAGVAGTTGPGNSFWNGNTTKLAGVAEEHEPVSPAMSPVPVPVPVGTATAIADADASAGAATVGKSNGANIGKISGFGDGPNINTSIVTGSADTQAAGATFAAATRPNPESSSSPSSSSNPTVFSSLPFPFPRPPKIRKPSLRTLISSSSSTNTSRAPSPSPISVPGGDPTPAMRGDNVAHLQSQLCANSKPIPVPIPMQLQMTSSSSSSPASGAGHDQNTMTESGATVLGLATPAKYPPPRSIPSSVNNANANSDASADPFGLGLSMGSGPTLDLSLANIHVHGLRQESNLHRDAIHGPGDQSPTLFSGPMSLDD